MSELLLCCDWGSSSFRLRLMNVQNKTVITENNSDEGIASVWNAFQSQMKSGVSLAEYYLDRLESSIADLPGIDANKGKGIPLVISGMASSSLGLVELPYATAPFQLDGSSLVYRQICHQAEYGRSIYILSGVRNGYDVMRGEETQLVGAINYLHENNRSFDEGIWLFPGTHSKHLYTVRQQLTEFKTFMTGELFALMQQHSMLKASVSTKHKVPDSRDMEAFRKGVLAAQGNNLLPLLFSVRTNQLFKVYPPEANNYYLSGLIIGAEVSALSSETGPVMLCSGNRLYALYLVALNACGIAYQTIEPHVVENAAFYGQILFYKNINGIKD